jgi:hypothetical protein
MTELKIWPATTVLMQLQPSQEDVTAEQLAAFERTIQALRIDMSEEHLAMFTKHGELQFSSSNASLSRCLAVSLSGCLSNADSVCVCQMFIHSKTTATATTTTLTIHVSWGQNTRVLAEETWKLRRCQMMLPRSGATC